jgi:hypothetical protein
MKCFHALVAEVTRSARWESLKYVRSVGGKMILSSGAIQAFRVVQTQIHFGMQKEGGDHDDDDRWSAAVGTDRGYDDTCNNPY